MYRPVLTKCFRFRTDTRSRSPRTLNLSLILVSVRSLSFCIPVSERYFKCEIFRFGATVIVVYFCSDCLLTPLFSFDLSHLGQFLLACVQSLSSSGLCLLQTQCQCLGIYVFYTTWLLFVLIQGFPTFGSLSPVQTDLFVIRSK